MEQLNYQNPDDWGKSPLTDNALRLQQMKEEIAEEFSQPKISDNLLDSLPCLQPPDETKADF